MFSMIFGIISGALSALSAFGGSMAQGNAQRQQAAYMQAQANMARKNADIEQERGRVEAYEQDRRKSRLRREFEDTQAVNRVSLGAGNVEMSSGSALDVSLANIQSFAQDMGDNAYAMALRQWEADEKVKNLRYQADAMDANASYLNRSAANVGSSLLTAGITGLGGFASGYSMAGGKLSSLFGSDSVASIWDKEAPGGMMMRHPSGKWAFARR